MTYKSTLSVLMDLFMSHGNAIALSTRSLLGFIKDIKTLEIIEQQLAQILEDHYLKDSERQQIAELSRFSVCRGIHTCELRYKITKADAAKQLLAKEAYKNVTHITFMGDDFGQPDQPGTDYFLAKWIKAQAADPQSTFEGCVIQVLPEENYSHQKQLLTSPAQPDIVLTSTAETGKVLNIISKQALEIKSTMSLINQSIMGLQSLFTQENTVPKVNSSDSIGTPLGYNI